MLTDGLAIGRLFPGAGDAARVRQVGPVGETPRGSWSTQITISILPKIRCRATDRDNAAPVSKHIYEPRGHIQRRKAVVYSDGWRYYENIFIECQIRARIKSLVESRRRFAVVCKQTIRNGSQAGAASKSFAEIVSGRVPVEQTGRNGSQAGAVLKSAEVSDCAYIGRCEATTNFLLSTVSGAT